MKRLFALIISGMLLASSLPIHSFAAEMSTGDYVTIAKGEEKGSGGAQPTASGLESAILAIKEKITIPEAYTEFNYYFYNTNSYSDAYWSLTWRNPKDESYVQVNCDADYHITYLYQYNPTQSQSTGVAKYLKSELKATAEAFLSKIAPETEGFLTYQGADYDGIYSGNYVFRYIRVKNNVEFPDNEVTVSVNSVTGKVTATSINWLYKVSVPTSTTKITKEEATKLIKENMKMKLVYRSNYYRIYDTSGTPAMKAYLVYEPTLNYISIDAKTGEIYLNKSQLLTTDAGGYMSKDEASAAATTENSVLIQTLTEEEIAKISGLKKIISESKAISMITGNTSLYLDKNLKSYSATLNKTEDISGKTSYVWNISLNDPRPVDYTKDSDTYRAYAYGTVDAVTGKILSFYSSVKGYYIDGKQTWKDVKIVYDSNKSKTILEKFLKKQASDRFNNSVLASEHDDYVISYKEDGTPIYGGYNFQYNRVNEGIEYPYNYLYGSVDGVTGKIYSFGSYWNENVEFESSKGAITADQAMDYYLSNEGYGLKYEINSISKENNGYSTIDISKDTTSFYNTEYQIRLVYRPDVSPAYISPFTGKQLKYDGKVYAEVEHYAYKDIENTNANRNILLLADMNIGFQGGYFNPMQAVTTKEILGLLKDAGYGYDTTEIDSSSEKQITREELASLFVGKLGLEKMAALSGIYRTDYADEASIGKRYLGAVALAKGFGLMGAYSGNSFVPSGNVSRAEAVDYIMNFINAQQKGIY